MIKKFSNITGQKVGEEPKLVVKLNEEDIIKSKILNLMDQLLSIKTYGPIDRYMRAGNIKITGKELFLEALINLMSDKSLKEQSKLLEGLKSNVKDWEIIDNKISEVNNKLTESNEKSKTLPYKNKLISIFNNYKDDEEMILQIVEGSLNKITNSEKAFLRHLAASQIASEGKYPKDIFNKISEKFQNKAQQLGYKI